MNMSDGFFRSHFYKQVNRDQVDTALSVFEVLMLRDRIFQLSAGNSFTSQDFRQFIAALAC